MGFVLDLPFNAILRVIASSAIISLRKRELVALMILCVVLLLNAIITVSA